MATEGAGTMNADARAGAAASRKAPSFILLYAVVLGGTGDGSVMRLWSTWRVGVCARWEAKRAVPLILKIGAARCHLNSSIDDACFACA